MLLSNFCKIAKKAVVSFYPVQMPNEIIQVGILEENKKGLPQIEILKANKLEPIIENTVVDSSYKNVAGAGNVNIPSTSDFWVGDMYGY